MSIECNNKVNPNAKVAAHGYSTKRKETEESINKDYYKPWEFDKCAVAADNIVCSKIGKNIMKEGGTAADAVVSTHCCVEVMNSHSTGLGGGGFMVYYDKKSGEAKSYNFRETLPAAYKDGINKTAGETILVPGVLRGLEAVWKDYGKLPWEKLWEPCIQLAEEGFRIHHALDAAITHKAQFIHSNLGLKELYAPDGVILKKGEILRRPKLAKTYRKIAKEGAEIFYQGSMAKQIVKEVQQAGGLMTIEDLAAFQVESRKAIHVKIAGYDMYTTPAPSSGTWLALTLKVWENLKWTAKNLEKNAENVFHKMIETFKYAYAPATYLGDPRKTKYTAQVEDYMTSSKTASEIAKRIDNHSYGVEHYKPYSEAFSTEKTGTSHMSLLDPHGSAVSLTSSINAYFGSKLRSRNLGFIYNNELADFSEFWPSLYNLTKDEKIGGKRPMSKSMPTIFVDSKKGGNVQGVFGAAGGFFIPTALSMTIANWLFFKDNLKIAVSRPRLHCQLFPPTVMYEKTMPPQMIPKLQQDYGHVSMTNDSYDVSGQPDAIMGVVQAIVRLPNGKLAAECDYRKGGAPDGF